jgi:hypothetical protein
MRTLWAGILETDVLCHSHPAAELIVDLREGHTIALSDALVIRAIHRNSTLLGFGLVVAQSPDPSATFGIEAHEQYLWLVEGWMLGNGIGPKERIQLFVEDIDPVPNVPEQWK